MPLRNPFERSMRTFAAFEANDRGIGYNFWIFHGINYLSNNPFPEIYQGAQIFRGTIFSHIMEHHLTGNVLTQRGRECLVWAGSSADELFRAVLAIKAFAAKYNRRAVTFNDPYVRVAVEACVGLMVGGTQNWGVTEPPDPATYYQQPQYHRTEMSGAARNVLAHDPRTPKGWTFWADLHRQTIATLGLPPKVKPFRLERHERKDHWGEDHHKWKGDARIRRNKVKPSPKPPTG